ncbi:MAG: hypothetical protein NWE94_07330 [Candidatus Bathyarchaeota archaeon]|nr:hypothetical protein [Candidatus Bathyarchaeota archaeon]
MKIYAYSKGWILEAHGLWHHAVSINSSSEMIYFTVDTTPPTILFLSMESNTSDPTGAHLNLIVSESPSRMEYSLDGKENIALTGNVTLTNLPAGKHNFTVYVSDAHGNTASKTTTFSVAAPFPTVLVAAAVAPAAVAFLCVLVYLKKRNG